MMDLFAGFNYFLDTFLVFILTTIFEMVGLALCIIPVLIVAAFYLFPYAFVVDRKLSFWDAMEASRKVAQKDLMGFIIFVVLLAGLNLVGALLLGVGLLFTIPISVAAVSVAYEESVGFLNPPVEPRGAVNIP